MKQKERPIGLVGRLEPVDVPTLGLKRDPPLVMEILVVTTPGAKLVALPSLFPKCPCRLSLGAMQLPLWPNSMGCLAHFLVWTSVLLPRPSCSSLNTLWFLLHQGHCTGFFLCQECWGLLARRSSMNTYLPVFSSKGTPQWTFPRCCRLTMTACFRHSEYSVPFHCTY